MGLRSDLPNFIVGAVARVDDGCLPNASAGRYRPGAGVALAPRDAVSSGRPRIENDGALRSLGRSTRAYEPGPGVSTAVPPTALPNFSRPRMENAGTLRSPVMADFPSGRILKYAPGPCARRERVTKQKNNENRGCDNNERVTQQKHPTQ